MLAFLTMHSVYHGRFWQYSQWIWENYDFDNPTYAMYTLQQSVVNPHFLGEKNVLKQI